MCVYINIHNSYLTVSDRIRLPAANANLEAVHLQIKRGRQPIMRPSATSSHIIYFLPGLGFNNLISTHVDIRTSVAEPQPEPPEPYHFDPRRTGTVSFL